MNEMPGEANYDELIDLAFAVCDGTATDAQVKHVEEILTGDPAAALCYLECLDLHFDLDYRGRRSGLDRRAVQRIGKCTRHELPAGARIGDEDEPAADAPPLPHSPATVHPPEALDAPLPTPGATLSPFPSPLSPLYYLLGSVLCSYLAAALILGSAVVAAWAWNASGGYGVVAVAARTLTPVPRACHGRGRRRKSYGDGQLPVGRAGNTATRWGKTSYAVVTLRWTPGCWRSPTTSARR